MGFSKKIIAPVLLALALAGCVALALFAYSPRTLSRPVPSPSGEPPPLYPPAVDGKRTYLNHLLGFVVQYPEELAAREYGDGNTSTVTFEDEKGEKGFQVFVVPYDEPTVSDARLKMDLPSGVVKEAVTVLIDGVEATAFFSANLVMGETREVWFIKNGYLYEVSTYKELDSWLAEIMRTWRFTRTATP